MNNCTCFNADILMGLANQTPCQCGASSPVAPKPAYFPLVVPGAGEGDAGRSAYQIAVDNGFDGTESEWLAGLAGVPVELWWTASITTANYQAASASSLPSTPMPGSISVEVSSSQRVGDGVRTTDCYFSADNGATARSLSAIQQGDKLFWNQGVAGFSLDTTDTIIIRYRTQPN